MDIQKKNMLEEYVNFVTLGSLPNAIGLDEVREESMNDQKYRQPYSLLVQEDDTRWKTSYLEAVNILKN